MVAAVVAVVVVIVIVVVVVVVVGVGVVVIVIVIVVPRRTPWRLVVSIALNLRFVRHSCSRTSTIEFAGAGQRKRGSA